MNLGEGFKGWVKRVAHKGARRAILISRLKMWIDALIAVWHRVFGFPAVYFGPGVKLIGISRMAIGRNSAIGARSWLNVNERGLAKDALVIGNNCFVGQDSFFTVGRSIRIGDFCLTARGCAFLGSAHVYTDPTVPYLLTGTTEDIDIFVGANCFFGYAAMVIGNVRIGHGSVIGAGAEVRQDAPPYSLLVGRPAKVVKRFDFGRKEWIRWPAENYVEGPDEDELLQLLTKDRNWFALPLAAAAGGLFDIP